MGARLQINPDHLTVRPKGIHEITGSRLLSDHVCGLMHPHVYGGEFFHYTGLPGFTSTTWFGLFARRGTPDTVIAKIRDAMKVVAADPKVIALFQKTGGNVMNLSPEDTEALVKRDVDR